MKDEALDRLRAELAACNGEFLPPSIGKCGTMRQLLARYDAMVEADALWTWLAERKNLELDWGCDDEDEASWRVHQVSGGRNDREWTLISSGETPLAAVQAARTALGAPNE